MQLPDFTSGQILTAAQLDAAFAQLFPVGAAAANYIPTLTQGVAVNKTVEYAEYLQIGAMAFVQLSLSVTSAGTAGQPVVVGLPPLVPATFRAIGVGGIYDLSAPSYFNGHAYWLGATTFRLIPASANAAMGQVGAPFAVALAAGDLVMANLAYRTTSN